MAFYKTIVAMTVLASSVSAHAQIAGAQPLSVTVEQSQALLEGWTRRRACSARRSTTTRTRKSVPCAI